MRWVLAFHIIFMVTWFAGLFYLPRLFVYHAMGTDAVGSARFKVMERKLYYGIMMPGALLTTLLGGWLITWQPEYYLHSGWMLAKLALVALTWAYHFYCGHLVRVFKQDRNQRSHVFYRWFNEVPVLFLGSIVVLVVVRPF